MIESFIQIKKSIPDIHPEVIFTIKDFPITNSFNMTVLILVFFLALTFFVIRKFKIIPSLFQAGFEILIEKMEEIMTQITANQNRTRIVFPLVATIFVYIGVSNLFGLIPGVSSFEWDGKSLFRTATSDFNTTFGIALAMIVLIQIVSIKEWGVLGYVGRFLKFKELYLGFKGGIKTGMTAFIEFLIGLLDIISEFAKIISLSLRLFGNIFASEVLAILALSAFAFVLPAMWLSVNLLFSVVQALVFGSLVVAYYSLSINPEKDTPNTQKNEV